ncbi:F0F1 ATP synthase subunit gamma [bacterium]|nr:F0F1 ATP synthase subunit gamma [bacterium]
MANIRQVKARIKATTNLQKIVKALEIVSTVKLQKLKGVIGSYKEFLQSFLEVVNIVRKEVNLFDYDKDSRDPHGKRLLVVVTGDKGLCGAVNSRIFKRMEKNYGHMKDKADVFVIGKKGLEYFVLNGRNVVGSATISDNVLLGEVDPISAFIAKAIEDKKYSKIKVYFNFYKNVISQVLTRFKLYPLDENSFNNFLNEIGVSLDHLESIEHKFLMIEPDVKTFKFDFLQNLIRIIIFSAVLHNKTTEYASRMMAMKNAKDNCKELMEQLTLLYNKTRQ